MTSKALVIIAGAGPGTGAAIAKRFAELYNVVLLARTPASYNVTVKEIRASGGSAFGIPTDCSDEKSVKNAFSEMEKQFPTALLAAAIYNVGGSFVRKPFLEIDAKNLRDNLEIGMMGGFYFAQSSLPKLIEASKNSNTLYPPTLLFTGATASLKGSPQCEAFSPGKFAMRSLSQSLAKEFGPRGVHVSHVIIDGAIDTPSSKGYLNDVPDAKLSTHAIADTYFHLHSQPRTTWTWELDVRPYVENW